MPRRHRSHSTDFKRQVVAEYHAGETLHALGRRHDVSRNLIRIWIEKAEAGALDEDAAAAELLSDYEARIAALERLVGRQALEIELSQRGATLQSLAEKRAYIRDRRPANLSIQRGCELMGVSRSSVSAVPIGRPADAVILAEIRAITDEFEGYGYRRVDAELRHRGVIVNAKKVRKRDLAPTFSLCVAGAMVSLSESREFVSQCVLRMRSSDRLGWRSTIPGSDAGRMR